MNVTLLDALANRAFFAAIPQDLRLARRLMQSSRVSVRWIGSLTREDKLDPIFRRSQLLEGIRDTAGRVPLLVIFFGDVAPEAQLEILQRRGAMLVGRVEVLNGWTSMFPPDSMSSLAGEDAVQWVSLVPPGLALDNDAIRSAKGVNAEAILGGTPYNLSGSGVTVALWDWTAPSLTHLDLFNRVIVGDPVPPLWSRTWTHTEAAPPNGQFNASEGIYVDMNDSEKVDVGDYRVSVPGFGNWTLVQAGHTDAIAGGKLILFNIADKEEGIRGEAFVDENDSKLYTPTEPIYRDMDFDGFVSAGDVHIAGNLATPGDRLYPFPTDPHWHSTMVAGTIMGNGANSAAEGNKWKGVASAATLLSYGVCSPTTCDGAEWMTTLSAEYANAATAGGVIAANPWGPLRSHCHEAQPEETCYSALGALYDAYSAGRKSDGTATGVPKILITGSAGNAGRPERHAENVAVNGRFDAGEAIYVDSAGDGKVTADDVLLLPPEQPYDTQLIDFSIDEMHAMAGLDTGTFEAAEGIYVDVDRSRTVSVGDVRVSVPSLPAGPVVDGDPDEDVHAPLRQFRLWGNIRIPNAAKNTIQTGTIAADAIFLPAFSSRGPTDDGRLKPDVVTAGSRNSDAGLITSTYPRNAYRPTEGTSISTAAVAGTAALVTQWFKEACSAIRPAPELLKALLIHGSEDVAGIDPGTFPGPDFASGYGRLRAKEAVDLLPHHIIDTMKMVGAIDFVVTLARTQPLKVTLVWADLPWTLGAAPGLHGILKNDLDLVLIGPDGAQHTAWVMSGANPLEPAVRHTVGLGTPIPEAAWERRNPVEQVLVDDAGPGTWIIRVTTTSDGLMMPPQPYALVSEVLPVSAGPCAATPAANVWVRDNATDTGAEPSSGDMWLGPDLWNRLSPDGVGAHQNPEYGQPNYLYATIRNASPVSVKATEIQMYIASASLGLSWPNDFTYVGRIFSPKLAPNEVRQVGPFAWYPPAPTLSGHFCMYMRLETPQDPIGITETSNIWTNARTSNNIAYRNLNIVDLHSSRSVTFLVRNTDTAAAVVDIIVRVPEEFLAQGEVQIALSAALEQRWRQAGRRASQGLISLRDSSGGRGLPLRAPGVSAQGKPFRVARPEAILPGFELRPRQAERVTMTFSSPVTRSAEHNIDVMQRVDGQVIGGIRYVVRTGRRR